MTARFETFCLIGTGLIGGSFALKCREVGMAKRFIGFDRDSRAARQAVELGLIDEALASAELAVRSADLVLVAVPPAKIVEVLAQIGPHLKPRALLMDTGSTKASIVSGASQLLTEHVVRRQFVGAHPIAGTEKSGPSAAFSSLFEGAKCILTPTDLTAPETVQLARSVWEQVGTRVVEMSPETHDLALAAVSHLPHMVAYALVNVIAELSEELPAIVGLSGGGFKDTTRIASSHPEMWSDICFENKAALLKTIDKFERHLGELKQWVQNDDAEQVYREFELSRRNRARILEVPYDG